MLLIIDEGNPVFPRELDQEGFSFTATALREGRNLGIIFVVGLQEWSRAAHSLRSNMGTCVILRVKEGEDLFGIGTSFQLTPEQIATISQFQQPGEACMVASYGYTKPMHILTRPPELIHDPEAERKSEEVLQELLSKGAESKTSAIEEILQAKSEELDSEMIRYLKIIQEHPDLNITASYEYLGWPRTKGNRIKKYLIARGFLVEKKVYTGKRGPEKRLELLPKARKVLEERHT
jgi:hypothetical protein